MDRINLETYPKSGTGYLYSSLKLSFLNYLVDFPHHAAYGLNRNNLITIVRNPQQCITSWAFETKNKDIKSLEAWYIRFLQKTESKKSKIYIVNFDDYIKKHDFFLKDFADKFELKNYQKVSNQDVLDYMRKNLPNNLPKESKQKKAFTEKTKRTYDFKKSLFWYNEVMQ